MGYYWDKYRLIFIDFFKILAHPNKKLICSEAFTREQLFGHLSLGPLPLTKTQESQIVVSKICLI